MFLDPQLFFEAFFILLFGHFLADFAFQSEYMAKAKNPITNPKEIWITVMTAHCMLHAGIVFVLTGKLYLALFQLVSHFAIDWCKCKHWLGRRDQAFVRDQLLHVGVLLIIAMIFCFT